MVFVFSIKFLNKACFGNSLPLSTIESKAERKKEKDGSNEGRKKERKKEC